MDLKEETLLRGDAGSHWYYRAKLNALKAVAAKAPPRSLLDVGAGSGFFARGLLRETDLARAACVDPGYPGDSLDKVSGKPLVFLRTVDKSDADLVLMMDVLEHVPDDAGLVAEYVAKVASGTRFFVTVPAFQWLWSGHDVFLEHYRRYTLKRLEKALVAGGLKVERGSYLYGAVFPLAAASRMASKLLCKGSEPKSAMRPAAKLENSILGAACRAELPFFPVNRIAGLSATALAVKP